MGVTGHLPQGFTQGVISTLHKSGARDVLSNYRPITLLNTDYKLLTKVLANRLAPALGRAIGPEQSAYLPGRDISDRVWLLLLLMLNAQQTGVLALLDIIKAFDTLDREFVFAMLEAVGAGGFVRWVRALLSDTTAVVVVNGVASTPARWHAGVRQGCPLSPLLFLLAAWALSCHLKASLPGLRLGSTRQHCGQHADDTTVFLQSTAKCHVQPLVDAMEVYASATGQRVNYAKSKLLPMPGHALPPPGTPGGVGSSVCNIPVVDKAVLLGIELPPPAYPPANQAIQVQPGAEQPQPQPLWERLTGTAVAMVNKVCHLGMSAFGRAYAATAYGFSALHYAASHLGLPAAVARPIARAASDVVDRQYVPRANPGGPARRPPGVFTHLLSGHPKVGGFGLQSLPHHVLARHAAAGLRFLCHLLRPAADLARAPAWMAYAADYLKTKAMPTMHPASALLACAAQLRSAPMSPPFLQPDILPFQQYPLPTPLLLMARGIAALGPPVRHPTAPNPPPGPWCSAVPLWGNPWLNLELDRVYWRLFKTPRCMTTAWHMHQLGLALRDNVGTLIHPQPSAAYFQSLFDCNDMWHTPDALSTQVLGNPARLSDVQQSVWRLLPESWQAAVIAEPGDEPSQSDCTDALIACLDAWSWAPPGPTGDPVWNRRILVSCEKPPVRDLYNVILRDVHVERIARIRAFVQCAVQGMQPAPDVGSLHAGFMRTLSYLWPLPCPNQHKETLWRVAVNGVSGAGGHDEPASKACPCGWSLPAADRDPARGAPATRDHVFWHCPVAQAVVQEVQRRLPANVHVLKHHFWLCVPPAPTIRLAVWRVVGMAALSAIHKGNRVSCFMM
jgi:hypothetical protein